MPCRVIVPENKPQIPPGAVPGDGDRSRRALDALLELTRALSSAAELDELLGAIVTNASLIVEAERTSIFIYDTPSNRLWTRVAEGLEERAIELPLGQGIAGQVAETLGIINIADAYDDPRFDQESDQRRGFRTGAILAVPIVGPEGKLLGVLESMNKRGGGRFDVRDEALLTAVASQASFGMERARLTESWFERERLEKALLAAHNIQMRMLPANPTVLVPFDLSAKLRPARQVGGDLYDFDWTGGERLYFCIGDVAGKGVGAALLMAVAKTLLRANAAICEDPGKLLATVNTRLSEETDPTMFVTAFCAYLELSTGALSFCSAGHNPPYLIHTDGTLSLLKPKPGLALGVFPNIVYSVSTVTLAPGEAVYLYTDGVTEAENPAGELFSVERLEELLKSCAGTSAAEIIASTLAAVDEFSGGAPPADDVTVLCVRFRPDQH
jgi:phosphoserine phosphatase RsbU/P